MLKKLQQLIEHIILTFQKVRYHPPKKSLNQAFSANISGKTKSGGREQLFPHKLSTLSLRMKSVSPKVKNESCQ